MPLVYLVYYGQKSIIRQKIYINVKMLPDKIEPKLSVILLYYSTPALPVLTYISSMFENVSQFTVYLQYFLKIYSKFVSMS
jgi:hypothetical protein